MLTVRAANKADRIGHKIMIPIAWGCASLVNLFKRTRPVMMFEKYGRYEEGASILFERLIDKGYRNVFYIANHSFLPLELAEKYKRHIIEQFSFKHYYTHFRTRVLVSTEQAPHAIDYNNQSFLAWKHIRRGYSQSAHVHLQHGVMYMLSLASARLTGSRRAEKADFYKEIYVVSSEKEKTHLMEAGGYHEDELYFTGMPKFDRAYSNSGADKIVIMPTWRPWEENLSLADPEKTTYYRYTKKLLDAVPEEMKNKTIVLWHPFISNRIRSSEVEGHIQSYDEILRDTKLLITDYSSISYDAFYRGSNVVFDWSEKDDCMNHYGVNSRIMMCEEDAFGDICYTKEQLTDAIYRAYHEPQRQEYINHYRTIVSFHDGKNCDRVIDCLRKDGFL